MFKHLVYVNGHPFLVYTTTLDRASRTAQVHLAGLVGADRIGEAHELGRWEA